MKDQNSKDKPNSPATRQRLVDPIKAAFAAAAFAAAVSLPGCAPASSSEPYCPPDPTDAQLKAMSDAKVRECLEEADRVGHYSYNRYYTYYTSRGYTYARGSYPSSSRFGSGQSAFESRSSSSSSSSGSTYKSGSGGSLFSGGKSTGSASS